MANKQQFIRRVSAALGNLAKLNEEITGLAGVYTAREYPTGGSAAITQADLTDAGVMVPLAQFQAGIAVLGEFQAFCENRAVTTKDRKTILNQIREDI